MKRVLIVTYEFPPVGGGTGKAARNIGREIAATGREVVVLTSGFRGLPARERIDGMDVVRLPVPRRHLNYANALEVLAFAASGILFGRRRLGGFRPDATLAFMTIPCGPVAEWIRRRDGAPYATLLRGQDVPGYPEMKPLLHALAWPVTRAIWNRSARVAANSEGLAELARASAPRFDVAVVRNGVDAGLYLPREEPPAASSGGPRPLRAVYVGRLVRKKRIRELVRAVALARARLAEAGPDAPGIELNVVGFGPERGPLEALARELGVADAVRFAGRLDEPGVVAALRDADVFVNPSEGEGLPNAALEAMSCGLAVVLSDIGPHRELVAATESEPEAGLLRDGGSPEALAGALVELALDRAEAGRLGAAARRRVLDRFDWAAAARGCLALFGEA